MNLTPVITRYDALRLRFLLASDQVRGLNCSYLEEKLERAVIDAVGSHADRVAVNSTVLVREREANVCWIYTLVLPTRADVVRRHISVLSPLGATLLGQRAADELEWRVAGGSVWLRIEAVRHGRITSREMTSPVERLLLA